MTPCETCKAKFLVKAGGVVVAASCNTIQTDNRNPISDCVKRELTALGATPQLVAGECLEDKRQSEQTK